MGTSAITRSGRVWRAKPSPSSADRAIVSAKSSAPNVGPKALWMVRLSSAIRIRFAIGSQIPSSQKSVNLGKVVETPPDKYLSLSTCRMIALDILLAVNAEDFGMSPAVSRGILRAHREGV